MSNAPEEDDRTILSAASNNTSTTATNTPAINGDEDGHALAAGTLIGEFELQGKIGEGGFSIVYLAWDHSLERKVALKEYMPGSLAARRGPSLVAPRSERHRSTYEAGLRSFVNEAKLLAHFDHPSLVKVYRFWEANGTAYMVMPLYEGQTLKDSIQADRAPVSEAWLIDILTPLCDAIGLLHREQCFHRDIAPDNIILLKGSGRPLLLDFGAARRVIGDMTQALTVILKPGYAPVEQYAELPDMKQGPWTDVYALAATVHWVITGSTPPPAVGRLLNDQYQALAERALPGFTPAFLGAVDRALAARPEQRTQTITDFGHDLGLAPRGDTRILDAPSPVLPGTDPGAGTTQIAPRPAAAARRAGPLLALVGLACALAAAWWLATREHPATVPLATTRPQAPAPAPAQPPSVPAVPTPPSPAVARTPPPASPVESPASPTSLGSQVQSPASASRAAPPPTREAPPASAPVRKAPVETAATAASKPVKAEKASPPRSAECASILQRISLGESSPELMARFDRARCR